MHKPFIFTLAIISTFAFAPIAEAQDSCTFIGIKSLKEYIKNTKVNCFPTAAAAKNKGFSALPSTPLKGFLFSLDGTQEVPPVTTTATGECIATFAAKTKILDVICTHTASSVTGAHIHEGAVGVDGDIICDLGTATSPINATCTLTATQAASLHKGDLYVNVHTSANTGGEIRGQIE